MGTRDFKASFAAVARVREEQLERAREEGREEIRSIVRAAAAGARYGEEYLAIDAILEAIEPKR